MSNLLCIDWDYFFPNPQEGGFKDKAKPYGLFDWGHREAPFFIDMVWGGRAAAFLANDFELPTVNDEWKMFVDRFNLADGSIVYFADSNMHAGSVSSSDGEPFESVWLYDAHHDAGYSVATFDEWKKKNVRNGSVHFSCEDWMLYHHLGGAELHWRFPNWHESFKERLAEGPCTADECDMGHVAHGPFWPEGVALDAAVDDLLPLDVEFDTVFICRSGAWVPPWEDKKFMEFVESWPGAIEQVDGGDLDRHFNAKQAKVEADMMKELHAQVLG